MGYPSQRLMMRNARLMMYDYTGEEHYYALYEDCLNLWDNKGFAIQAKRIGVTNDTSNVILGTLYHHNDIKLEDIKQRFYGLSMESYYGLQ